MNSIGLKVDWCSYAAAKHAVMNWHYSQSMPAGKLAKLGVWENDRFIGAIIFGRGGIFKIGLPFKMTQREVVELVRVALRDHRTPVTRIIKIALKMLKAQSPGLRIVVSFADGDQGHIGGIYQGGNWRYLGKVDCPSGMTINGENMHPRSVVSKFGTRSVKWLRDNIDPSAELVYGKGKYKYAMPLDEGARKILESMAKPYPKRDKQAMTDTIGTATGQHRSSRSKILEEA